ncbi:MAG: tyrosine--tRNA ligase [Patescibacteria group bacterium]
MKQNWFEKFYQRHFEDWSNISGSELLNFILPKAETIITEKELTEKLNSGKKLKIKFGIDPTGAQIHLGHVVPIMLLRQFLRAGHDIDFIIGDFTARIGDPAGRTTERVPLTSNQIDDNQKNYEQQIARFIDLDKIRVHRNSSWLTQVSLEDLISILQTVSAKEALQRDDFRQRLKKNEGLSLAEIIYGVLMGLDSLELKNDIEVGGIDQLLNFQQCREVMAATGLEKETVITTPLIEGLAGDGQKMSKSLDNHIPLEAPADEKFGLIMSAPDNLITQYTRSWADINQEELTDWNNFILSDPLEAKKQLASYLVAIEAKNPEAGVTARENFERKFSQKVLKEEDYITIKTGDGTTIFSALANSDQFSSNNQLRRLFQETAIRLITENNEEEILEPDFVITKNINLRAGKTLFLKIKID